MADTKTYEVTGPFWDGPTLRQPGERLQLSAAQVKYRGDEIRLIDAEPALPPSKTGKAGTRA